MTFARLLGFDMRVEPNGYLPSRWPAERRNRYLIVPSVSLPLSVDTVVWPSIFRYFDSSAIPPDDPATINVEPVDFYHDVLGLWSDPVIMRAVSEDSGVSSARDAVPIAVEVYSRQQLESMDYWRAVLREDVVQKMPEWTHLGFDVADCSRMSGLANCSYERHEQLRVIDQWREALNDFGLFRDIDVALQFADFLNGRVPGHAPFLVYALYSLDGALNKPAHKSR